MVPVDPEELVRWDRPGPRYTSYPTVPCWKPIGEAAVEAALGRLREPAQVYVHLPFCAEQCTYCGCNMVVAGRRAAGERYLSLLERQLRGLPLPAERVSVQRIHLGGGTPTWFDPEDLRRLAELLRTRFQPVRGAELSVEADPQVTTTAHLRALDAEGFNRLSMGVQSLDPEVLAAVNRPQSAERVRELLDAAGALGWWGLNLDLMYGLPRQDEGRFGRTLERVFDMRPDRLAVFGYAHVPWMKRHQRRIDAGLLPDTRTRAALYLLAHRAGLAAGYQPLGLDHLALPGDELSVARRERRLHRNFMGYTTLPEVDMVGLGMSAISEVAGVYWQQDSHLGRWMRAVERGASPVVRGHALTPEDRLRRAVVNALMCNLELVFGDVESRFGIDFRSHFSRALAELEPLREAGFLEIGDDVLRVTERGRLLVRLAAMPFDEYLRRGKDGGPRFSRAI